MKLTDDILKYAGERRQFTTNELIREVLGLEGEASSSRSAVAKCLRRLKSGGYLWNKRDVWYVRKKIASMPAQSSRL
ncbi:hypothetical protein [Paenibacillus sp.]|uniref:hypothetical protein n=1 Tax=Paenibacillus sp. TaxID=58172 RepID=UPI002D4DE135|nr:hypothetical protein [Paenibacillus sp.]HZG87446.1 hypothetical protein [Paenibacillus sp.]